MGIGIFLHVLKEDIPIQRYALALNPVRAISDDFDILVAFDQETIDFNAHELISKWDYFSGCEV